MNLVFTDEAVEDTLEILEWWLENRDVKDLFEDELRAAERRVLRGPYRPMVFTTIDGVEIRRVLLKRTHHHLYYQCVDDTVFVIRVWGAPKLGPPVLRPPRSPTDS